MRLIDFRPKNFSAWIICIPMIIVPMFYFQEQWVGSLRVYQQQAYQIFAVAFFALFILRNVYLSLFLLWSLFSFIYYGCPEPSSGELFTITLSLIIYESVYQVIDDKNVKIVFNFIIWFAMANVFYSVMQISGWELIFKEWTRPGFQTGPIGFMGLKAMFGMLLAMAMPFVIAEAPFWSLVLFIPIGMSQCSCAVGGAIVAYLWHLWHFSKKWFYILVAFFLIGGTIYGIKDSQMNMFTDRANMWKTVIRDAVKRPLIGYGMDGFRSISPFKQFMYWKNSRTLDTQKIDVKDTIEYANTGKYDRKKYGFFIQEKDTLDCWDNPHNEFIQLLFEFGFPAVVIFGFLIADIKKRFTSFDSNLVQLTGFFLCVLVLSFGQFPFHLARTGIYIPIMLGVYYKLTDKKEENYA